MRSEKKTKADSGTRERDVVGGEERRLCRSFPAGPGGRDRGSRLGDREQNEKGG